MSYEQIKALETMCLGTNLREKIDQELHHKMGLSINHYLSGKISFCALVYSWIMLYKKAESTFNS